MRKVRAAFLIFTAFTTACTPIVKELRHSGGYPGHVLDARMFDASDSKKLQLLRATIILAMIARTGSTSLESREDGDTFVRYTIAAVDEINILAGHISGKDFQCELVRGAPLPAPSQELLQSQAAAQAAAFQAEASAQKAQASAMQAQYFANQAIQAAGAVPVVPQAAASAPAEPKDEGNPKNCFTYAVNFESDIKFLEEKLYKLALLSLPKEAAQRLLNDIGDGDILGSVLSAVKFALSSIDGLRSAAAVQRTGLEIEAWQKPDGERNCGADKIRTVKGAALCLGLPDDQVITSKKVDGLSKDVDDKSFHALMRNIYDSCRLAPFNINIGVNSSDIIGLRNERIEQCNLVQYKPKHRWQNVD